MLPSDHFVCDEAVLGASLRAAMDQIRFQPEQIVMLGISPEEADPELGYIVSDSGDTEELRSVSEFVEKPSGGGCARTDRPGRSQWNSFIFAAHGRTLLRAFEARCPELAAALWEIVRSPDSSTRPTDLADLYDRAPTLDFSRDILQHSPKLLRVLDGAALWLERSRHATSRERGVDSLPATAGAIPKCPTCSLPGSHAASASFVRFGLNRSHRPVTSTSTTVAMATAVTTSHSGGVKRNTAAMAGT